MTNLIDTGSYRVLHREATIVPYRFSRCIALQVPDQEGALGFYRDVMGLEERGRDGGSVELRAGENRLFIDKGPPMGPIMEFLVPDLHAAREELLGAGCETVLWEGKGGCCYVRDPFGFVFNLFEDPGAFE